MFKKFGAALSAVAITLALGIAVTPAAQATDDSHQPVPAAPTLTLSPATCDSKVNAVTISGLTDTDPAGKGHRFILYTKEGGSFVAQKQLNESERKKLYDGNLTAESFGITVPYGSEVGIAAYWRDAAKVHDPKLWTTVRIKFGKGGKPEDVNRLIPHVPMKTMTLVDPATLNCTPAGPAPKDSADDITVPTFALTPAQCEAGKATDNVMTVDKAQKHANYRFVATYNGKSISLNGELRETLWKNGKLSASDIKAAYPTFVFDYTKPISIQAYWFDAEKAYAPALYDTALKLTVGDSARFIKRGEAKTLTLVDPATLNCKSVSKPDDNQTPKNPQTSEKPKADSKAKDPKSTSVKPKVAKTGFESTLLSLVGLLALGGGAAAMITLRARTRQ